MSSLYFPRHRHPRRVRRHHVVIALAGAIWLGMAALAVAVAAG